MKVLVIADTHGDPRLKECLPLAMACDLVIHLGDRFEDAQRLAQVCPIPVVQVTGSEDFPFSLIHEKMIALDRYDVLLTHGHLYHVQSGLSLLLARARALAVQLVLYGLLHRKRYEILEGIHFFCPGSPYRQYDGSPPTVGLLEINDGVLTPSWVELPPLGE